MEIKAEDIFSTLPARFKKDLAKETEITIHFDLSRPNDDNFQITVIVNKGNLDIQAGNIGEASCTIKAKEKTYVDLTLGKGNAQLAILTGKVKVSNLGVLTKFIPLFKSFSVDYLN